MNHISSYSDTKLVSSINRLVNIECATTVDILFHLIEVESRKLYLGLGHGSLFQFATVELGYSEPAAVRRISASRLMSLYPEVREMLLAKKLSLTTASLIKGVITKENSRELLGNCAGKSRRQVEEILSVLKPKNACREQIKAISLREPQISKVKVASGGETDKNSNYLLQDMCPPKKDEPVASARYELRFSVSNG